MVRRYVTRADVVLIVTLLLVSGVTLGYLTRFGFAGKHTVVEVDGHRVLELPLDRDVTTSVHGPLGETVIAVEDGTVRIVSSPCPHGYCVRMGRLRFAGETAVCVPNHVIVTITGGSRGYDGVTQ